MISSAVFRVGCDIGGALCRIDVNDAPVPPTSSPEIAFPATDVVRLRLPGGGGYGDPAKRDRRLIESDLLNGYATPENARRDYGWGGGEAHATRE